MDLNYARKRINQLVAEGRMEKPAVCTECKFGVPQKYFPRGRMTQSIYEVKWWCVRCHTKYRLQGGFLAEEQARANADVDTAYIRSATQIDPQADTIMRVKGAIKMIMEEIDGGTLEPAAKDERESQLMQLQAELVRLMGFDEEQAIQDARARAKESINPWDVIGGMSGGS